jgi:hypothetical protein
MLSSAEKAGGFQRGLFEGFSPSSAAARLFEQRKGAEGHGRGCLLLWLLSFGQAKESNLPSGNPD